MVIGDKLHSSTSKFLLEGALENSPKHVPSVSLQVYLPNTSYLFSFKIERRPFQSYQVPTAPFDENKNHRDSQVTSRERQYSVW